MNIKKNLLLGAFAAFGIASASAAVTYITGSTAFESVASTALLALPNATRVAWDNATPGKETYVNYTWGVSSATNTICVHWTGSEGGVQCIAAPTNNPAPIAYFPTNASGLLTSSSATDSKNGQIAFGDTYQSTSIFKGTAAGDGKTYATISGTNDAILAVQGFVVFGGTNYPTANTNVTSVALRQLYANGALSLAVITGNPADQTNSVFALGRNLDSGTRLVDMGEFGIGVRTSVVQYTVTSSNNVSQYPIETINGISSGSVGNSGYSSTGSLVTALQTALADGSGIDTSAFPWTGYSGHNYTLGYAAATKIGTAGIVPLTYNGVAATTANIENGSYTLWAYEHLFKSPNYADAVTTTVFNNLKTTIQGYSDSTLGAGNAKLSNMTVTRSKDAGNISQNY